MNDKSRKFFSGDTVEAAVMKAARHHQLDAEVLAYRKVDKRHGFLRRRGGVVIEVDPESPRLEPAAGELVAEEPAVDEVVAEEPAVDELAAEEAAVDEPVFDAAPEEDPAAAAPMAETADIDTVAGEPAGLAGSEESGLIELPEEPTPVSERYPPAPTEVASSTKEGLQLLFEVADLDLESGVLEGDDELEINLWGRDQKELVADRGKLLLSIQHLLPRLLRGLTGRAMPCRVDSDNFHEIRQERLRDLAQQAAAEVQRGGDSQTLEPMAPDERRIVHLTLADDTAVVTESHGEGFYKRVTIRPARRRPRGFDRV